MAQITIEAAEAGDKVVEELQNRRRPFRSRIVACSRLCSRQQAAPKRPTKRCNWSPRSGGPLMLGAQRASFRTRQSGHRAAGVIADLMRIPGGRPASSGAAVRVDAPPCFGERKKALVIPGENLSPGAVQPWMEEAAQ